MGEVEWSASSSETNPMLGIGRQSKRQSIGIMWGLSCPTLAGGGGGGGVDGSGGSFRTGINTRQCWLPPPRQTLHMLFGKGVEGWRWHKGGGKKDKGGKTGTFLSLLRFFFTTHPSPLPSPPNGTLWQVASVPTLYVADIIILYY